MLLLKPHYVFPHHQLSFNYHLIVTLAVLLLVQMVLIQVRASTHTPCVFYPTLPSPIITTSDLRLQVRDDIDCLLQDGEFGLRLIVVGVECHHTSKLFEGFVDVSHTDSRGTQNIQTISLGHSNTFSLQGQTWGPGNRSQPSVSQVNMFKTTVKTRQNSQIIIPATRLWWLLWRNCDCQIFLYPCKHSPSS